MESYATTRYTYDPKRTIVWQEICRYLNQHHIPPSARVLELGCGYGDFIGNISASFRAAVEYDRFFSSYLEQHAGVEALWGDALEVLPQLPDHSFEVVFASNFFEHFGRDDIRALTGEVLRILAPKGRLVVIQPNFRLCASGYFDDWTHITVFSHISFCDFLAAHGFEVTHCQKGFLPFSFKSRLPVSRLATRWYLKSPVKPLAAQFLVVAEKPAQQQS